MSKREIWFARNEQAESLEHDGRIDEALALYQENAREGCDIPFTHERIASIQQRAGRMKESVEAYDRAIELEKRRGPSERLVRLQAKRDLAADLAARPSQAKSVTPRTRERKPETRTLPTVERKSGGCMAKASVIALTMLALAGAVSAAVL